MKNKMNLNWIKPRNWGIVKVYRDFENYFDWVKTIKKEAANPNSLYNKWGLKHTKFYDVYTVFSLDEVDLQLPEVVQRTKVIEYLNPVNRYFDEDLNFAECLSCEFNQYENEKKELTRTFLIVFHFEFNHFSLKWLIKNALITFLLILLIIRLKLIPLIATWISSLIALI